MAMAHSTWFIMTAAFAGYSLLLMGKFLDNYSAF